MTLSIRQRLIFLSLVSLMAFIGMSVYAIYNMAKINDDTEFLATNSMVSIDLIHVMYDGMNDMRRAEFRYMVTELSDRKHTLELYKQAVGDISRNISEFREQMVNVVSNVKESQVAAASLSSAAEELNQQAAQFKV